MTDRRSGASPPDRSVEDGYALIEVLVSTVISSAIVFLLVSALNAMGRSQDRIAAATETANMKIFHMTLLSQTLARAYPGYVDTGTGLTGDATDIVGETRLAPGQLESRRFEVSLREADEGVRLELRLRDETVTIAELGEGTFAFRYVDHRGEKRFAWPTEAGDGVDSVIMLDGSYAHMLPRQILVVQKDGAKDHEVASFDLPFMAIPPPRPQDRLSVLEN